MAGFREGPARHLGIIKPFCGQGVDNGVDRLTFAGEILWKGTEFSQSAIE